MFNKILLLLSMHFIGDFVFQNDFLANHKANNIFIMFVHAYLWTTCIVFGFTLLKLRVPNYQYIALCVGHMIIDNYKCKKRNKSFVLTRDLYIDQLLHIWQILITYLFLINF